MTKYHVFAVRLAPPTVYCKMKHTRWLFAMNAFIAFDRKQAFRCRPKHHIFEWNRGNLWINLHFILFEKTSIARNVCIRFNYNWTGVCTECESASSGKCAQWNASIRKCFGKRTHFIDRIYEKFWRFVRRRKNNTNHLLLCDSPNIRLSTNNKS